MSVELKIPEVGESITEVQVGRWLKKEGESVRKDEPIVEIETDKVTVELPAPVDGTISQQLKKEGEEAAVGDVVGYIEQGDGAVQREEPAPKAEEMEKPREQEKPAPPATAEKPAEQAQATAEAQEQVRMTPVARQLVEEHGLDAQQIPATGPGGRLQREDVEKYLSQSKQAAPAAAPTPAPTPAPAPPADQAGREQQVVPMTPIRKRIAQRLVDAQKTAALLTTFNEIDMTAVMAARSRYKDAFDKKYGIKLGFMSFFVKASIDALKQFPALNAEVRGTDIIYKNFFDIGIAISSGKGLVVPVLRNADRLSFAEVELAIADFAKRISENKLRLEELEGGTFTITNGGVFGSLLSTPIINPPQSGVLGMHAIQDRPIALNGEVKIRPMMYVALTYDHRLVDGREAVTFLKRLKEAIEDPCRMLMEI
jgi:2-oxoglutarate dehydrogenase E2 component (dihydrolipoamide succinyltransferase)